MRVRRNILPKCLRDWALFSIVVIFVPVVYLVEVTAVLPYFHQPNSWMHSIHFFLALFAVTNISSNFLGILMYDTSVPKTAMSSQQKPKWEFCVDCQKYVPPRSWHCKICKTCILKRDHHCLFAGCCIGHYNTRYFILFLIYMFFSCFYALVYNTIFLYHNVQFKSLFGLVKLICPMCVIVINTDSTEAQIYMLTFALTLVGFGLSGILLYHHMQMILKGKVTHERGNLYNLGWKKNLALALGENWSWAWLFPLIPSPLPSNGIEWVTTTELEQIGKQPHAKNL